MSARGFKSALTNHCPVCGEAYTKISGYDWEDEKKYHHSKKWGATSDHICVYNPRQLTEEDLENLEWHDIHDEDIESRRIGELG